jgi:hypothetical protein
MQTFESWAEVANIDEPSLPRFQFRRSRQSSKTTLSKTALRIPSNVALYGVTSLNISLDRLLSPFKLRCPYEELLRTTQRMNSQLNSLDMFMPAFMPVKYSNC